MLADNRKWHFGVLPFTGTGHLNPLLALSQELKRRGHRVTFFERPKIEERVRQAGLDFVPLQTKKFARPGPDMSGPVLTRNSGTWAQISTLRFNFARVRYEIQQYLDETPPALASARVDALLINEIALTGPTVAELLRLPYFLIATTVPHHFGWSSRSWFTGHRASTSLVSYLESQLLEISALKTRGPIRRTLDHERRKLELGPLRDLSKEFPCLAHITQLPQCLDFEHVIESAAIYYSGPWVNTAARPQVDFPWHRIDGRPLVYATLGTTRNVQPSVFRMIAAACADLNVQLVIALGNRVDPASLANLPGDPLVAQFAPQLELIKLASVVISHAGPNTSFEALMEAKPMIVIPLAYDQPAIAARLAHFGIAEVLPFKRLSAQKLQRALSTILGDPTYKHAAQQMQTKLRSIDGVRRAADIISVELEGYAARQQLRFRNDAHSAGQNERLARQPGISSVAR